MKQTERSNKRSGIEGWKLENRKEIANKEKSGKTVRTEGREERKGKEQRGRQTEGKESKRSSRKAEHRKKKAKRVKVNRSKKKIL